MAIIPTLAANTTLHRDRLGWNTQVQRSKALAEADAPETVYPLFALRPIEARSHRDDPALSSLIGLPK